MSATSYNQHQSRDARIWVIALLGSVGVNVLVIFVLAVMALQNLLLQPRQEQATDEKEKTRYVKIQPIIKAPEPEPMPERPDQFARTSPEQTSGIPDDPKFMGERDTLATSNATPDPNAIDFLPSQRGEQPRTPTHLETTESQLQDGDLASTDLASQPSNLVEPPQETGAEEVTPVEDIDIAEKEVIASAPPKEVLAQTPNKVDLPTKIEDVIDEDLKEPKTPEEKQPDPLAKNDDNEIKPKDLNKPSEPGFRGVQKRTEIKGSISRRGESSLDVKSGPMGKYHAELSRAVEKAWQREVIKNRDFITPGVLRIRIVLDENGYVRSVTTVEKFEASTIQVGFTHQAIRKADLPKMPAEVKKELEGEPLELLYNFIF